MSKSYEECKILDSVEEKYNENANEDVGDGINDVSYNKHGSNNNGDIVNHGAVYDDSEVSL